MFADNTTLREIFYPTDFLFTIGQPQPLADLQPLRVIVKIKNNKTDIWFFFFIFITYFIQNTLNPG